MTVASSAQITTPAVPSSHARGSRHTGPALTPYSPRFPARWRAGLAALAGVALLPFLTRAPLVVAPLIVVQAAAFWFFERWPDAATLIILAAGAALQAKVPAAGPGVAFVALCTYAWLTPANRNWWSLPAGVAAACLPALIDRRWGVAAAWAGAVLLAWSWGALGRARGARRAVERRQLVLEERARIARELHDVLSHTVSVMVVQAAAADDVFDRDPAKARQAIQRTEEAGRKALGELRYFLRSVRGEDDGLGGPQPSLADLGPLAETVRASGLEVSLAVDEGLDGISDTVQLCVYRIVQEALTNSLRHGGAGKSEISVKAEGGAMVVTVRDNGPGSAAGAAANGGAGVRTGAASRGGASTRGGSGERGAACESDTGDERGTSASSTPGHGLAGMRERAELLGGTLSAGPRPGGGFEVEARLPL